MKQEEFRRFFENWSSLTWINMGDVRGVQRVQMHHWFRDIALNKTNLGNINEFATISHLEIVCTINFKRLGTQHFPYSWDCKFSQSCLYCNGKVTLLVRLLVGLESYFCPLTWDWKFFCLVDIAHRVKVRRDLKLKTHSPILHIWC